jgi:hypothetical protein
LRGEYTPAEVRRRVSASRPAGARSKACVGPSAGACQCRHGWQALAGVSRIPVHALRLHRAQGLARWSVTAWSGTCATSGRSRALRLPHAAVRSGLPSGSGQRLNLLQGKLWGGAWACRVNARSRMAPPGIRSGFRSLIPPPGAPRGHQASGLAATLAVA